MKRIKLYGMSLALLIGVATTASVPAAFAASPQSTVCSTLGSNASCSSQPSNGVSLNGVIGAVVNILSALVGITSVIMIIIGGFKYITSNGDSNSIQSAKNTIIYAIVGLIVVVLAQTIVRFVLYKVTR